MNCFKKLVDKHIIKKEIEIQREIGKQLFLVNILHYENDRARKSGLSFLSEDDLAAWASMTRKDLNSFIDVCGALDPYNMVADAAEECCGNDPFQSEENAYDFVFFTYCRMGELFVSILNIDKFEDYYKKFAKYNYKKYSEKHEQYPVAEFYSTPEILEQVMKEYIRYKVRMINKALAVGYDWDVIISMMRFKFSEDRFNKLKEVLAEYRK